MQNIFLLAYFGIFITAVMGVGTFIANLTKLRWSSQTEGYTFSFAFGAMVYSYAFFFLGLTHLLYKPALVTLYFAGTFLFIYQHTIKRHFHLHFNWPKWSSLWPWLVLLFILFPLIPYLFTFPMSWDALAYHLVIPKFYFAHHSLPFESWFAQSAFPIGVESLFGFAEAIGDIRIANLIHFSFVIATTLYMMYGMRDILPKKVTFLAAFLFFFTPTLYSEAGFTPFIDYPFAFFAFLTMIAVYKFIRDKKLPWLWIIIFFNFFLLMIKFTSFFVMIASGLILLGWIIGQRKTFWSMVVGPLQNEKTILLSLVLLFFAVFPITFWYTRTYIATGNPVYPFFNNVFKGLGYEPGGGDVLNNDIILLNAFIGPMIQHFHTSADTEQDYVNLMSLTFYLISMVSSFVFVFIRRNRFHTIFTLFTFLVMVPISIIIGPLYRYFLFMVPVMSLLISDNFFYLFDHFEKWEWLKLPAAVYLGAFGFLIFLQIDATFYGRQRIYMPVPKREWLYFMSYNDARGALYKQDNYRIQEYANEHLDPVKDKILQLNDNRMYYLDIPAEFANPIPGSYFLAKDLHSGTDIYNRIKADGFTYVIVNKNWGFPVNMNKDYYQQFESNDLIPITNATGVFLYKVK